VREVHARNEVFGSVDGNFAAGHNCDKDQRDYVDDDYEFTHMIFTEFVVVTRKMAIMLTSVFPPSIVQALMSHGTATFYLIAGVTCVVPLDILYMFLVDVIYQRVGGGSQHAAAAAASNSCGSQAVGQ
jgi:hypothetical protein